MRRLVSLCCAAAVLAGCAKSDQQAAADTAAPAAAMPASPATIALGDVAGTWSMRSMPEDRDTVLVTYELTATADRNGWTMTFPGGQPIPVHVMEVGGDSIVTHAGPYESVLRKGVQVETNSVWRLRDGKLVGASVARYKTTGADSVLRARSEGTRAP